MTRKDFVKSVILGAVPGVTSTLIAVHLGDKYPNHKIGILIACTSAAILFILAYLWVADVVVRRANRD